MSGLAQDKTVNRVAICSAIFAGFAYVGYSVVRQAFGRRLMGHGVFKNEDDSLGLEYEQQPRNGRVYLRRLSGSFSSGRDIKLENLDTGQENGIIRPMAVLTRIRELNLGAKAFAETLLVLQGSGHRKHLSMSRSLQQSPTHATSMLSLMDMPLENGHDYEYEYPSFTSRTTSVEDLNQMERDFPPGLRRHASRRSLGKRSLANSCISLTQEQQESVDAEAERLLEEREEELQRRLQGFQSGRTRELTPYEAKSLVALLHSKDASTLQRTLVTISNCAAFTRNQDELRDSGCLLRLQSLLSGTGRDVRLAAITATANLALNTGNMKEMEYYVPLLHPVVESDLNREHDEELLSAALLALTNIAVLPDWHHQYRVLIPRLHELWCEGKETITLQVLKLLINLSCNDEIVPIILSSKVPGRVTSLLSPTISEELLLRSTRFLANLCVSAARLGNLSSEPEVSLQYRLFGLEKEVVCLALTRIMEDTRNMDIKLQARKACLVLKGIREGL